jgi:hypothetical protein
MRYMTNPVSFRWDAELLERIDAVREDVPRSAWVRRAVESRLIHEEPLEEVVARDRARDAERAAAKPSATVETPKLQQTESHAISKGVKPMVYCTVCDRSSASTKWGCSEHGYGKVKPFKERGL